MAADETYGVYMHSSGRQGGYVVRTMFDGWCPAPYNKLEPVRVFKRKHAAQAHANRMNAGVV